MEDYLLGKTLEVIKDDFFLDLVNHFSGSHNHRLVTSNLKGNVVTVLENICHLVVDHVQSHRF